MKKFLKNNIKLFLGIFIGIICSGITVYAASYLAKDIAFVPSDKNWEVSSVEEAINDLYNTKCDSSSSSSKTWDFDYTGDEQTFKATSNGTYKLEVWGASGGYVNAGIIGGYGGYSVGEITLKSGDILYINVGGKGEYVSGSSTSKGGYNGGGTGASANSQTNAGGGGATHIATSTGLLKELSDNKDSIIIVAGGGGGTGTGGRGGIGGGFQAVTGLDSVNASASAAFYGTAGTQTSGGYMIQKSTCGVGSFGQGADYCNLNYGGAGGGGGYYGGGGSARGHAGGGGGSGYIGNANLKNKAMYCYGCTESSDESTKTINISDASSYPVAFHVKKNNGYARISLINN